MDTKKLSAAYDRLYDEADKLFKEYNPCKFEDGRCELNRMCMEGKCGQPHHRLEKSGQRNGCCSGHDCEHLTPNGCSIKSLGCKLSMCGHICDAGGFYEFREKIKELNKETNEVFGYNAARCFLDKKTFFECLKIPRGE